MFWSASFSGRKYNRKHQMLWMKPGSLESVCTQLHYETCLNIQSTLKGSAQAGCRKLHKTCLPSHMRELNSPKLILWTNDQYFYTVIYLKTWPVKGFLQYCVRKRAPTRQFCVNASPDGCQVRRCSPGAFYIFLRKRAAIFHTNCTVTRFL